MANIDEHLPNDSSLQMYGQKMTGASEHFMEEWPGMAPAGSAPLRATQTIILVLELALTWGPSGEFHPKSVA